MTQRCTKHHTQQTRGGKWVNVESGRIIWLPATRAGRVGDMDTDGQDKTIREPATDRRRGPSHIRWAMIAKNTCMGQHTQTHNQNTKTKMRSWNTSVWEAACPCRTQDYTARQRVDGTMGGVARYVSTTTRVAKWCVRLDWWDAQWLGIRFGWWDAKWLGIPQLCYLLFSLRHPPDNPHNG